MNKSNAKKQKTMKQAANEDLDKTVYTWFVQKPCQGFSASGVMITGKALMLNRQLGGSKNLQASHGWLVNFCARHGI